jgi:hypothetical protein
MPTLNGTDGLPDVEVPSRSFLGAYLELGEATHDLVKAFARPLEPLFIAAMRFVARLFRSQ